MNTPFSFRLKKNDRTIVYLLLAFALIFLLDFINIQYSNTQKYFLPGILIDALYSALSLYSSYYLLYQGTFFRSKLWRWMNIAIPLIMIGAVLKIMHWPGSSYAILAGFTTVCVIYSIHFFRKNSKRLYDVALYCWALSTMVVSQLVFFHLVRKDVIDFIPSIAYGFTLIAFFLSRIEKKIS